MLHFKRRVFPGKLLGGTEKRRSDKLTFVHTADTSSALPPG
jgi:hypothetical protein